MECLFCKIANGEIKTDFIYQDEHVVAFSDIKPQAPVHVIIIPRAHIEKMQDINATHKQLLGNLLGVIPRIAKMKKVDKTGYRTVINCNEDAGQAVFHLHVHLLGGRKFMWPPG